MKWIIIVLFSVLCIPELKAQCPPGEEPHVVFDCDFRLHRNKFACKKGFWFCYRCEWKVKCWPTTKSASLGMVYARIVDNKFFEFHFSNEVIEKQNFTEKEKSVFNVDDALIFEIDNKRIQLVVGDYPTNQLDDELIVQVPFKTLKSEAGD
jgi:hypothetical protein